MPWLNGSRKLAAMTRRWALACVGGSRWRSFVTLPVQMRLYTAPRKTFGMPFPALA